jgi:hypothetical protein
MTAFNVLFSSLKATTSVMSYKAKEKRNATNTQTRTHACQRKDATERLTFDSLAKIVVFGEEFTL